MSRDPSLRDRALTRRYPGPALYSSAGFAWRVIMLSIERAISIRQPWVELILCGVKRAEFRSRPTRIRGRVYLYASLTPADAPAAWRRLSLKSGELPAGAILGSVEIADCRWSEREKAYAYLLRYPRRLIRPLYPRNKPQPAFWRPKL